MFSIDRVVLASASPRRRELLTSYGVTHQAFSPDIVEQREPGEAAADYVLRNARLKAEHVRRHHPQHCEGAFVIAGDTVVCAPDGSVLEKPRDAENAKEMLRSLSGKQHEVLSSVVILFDQAPKPIEQQVVSTRVEFAALRPDWIDAYVATGDPLDKAGAYGIQSLAGVFVKQIEGSYSNVVGLPLFEALGTLSDLHSVRTFFADAAPRPERFVAISKKKSEACIRLAHTLGQREFGENYAQELAQKAKKCADLDGIRWHYTGTLQTGRLQMIAQFADVVHALEDVDKARILHEKCQKIGRKMDVFVKCATSGSTSASSGCSWEEAAILLKETQHLNSLRMRGFMGMGTLGLSRAQAQEEFVEFLRKGQQTWFNAGYSPEDLDFSLGMTQDIDIVQQAAESLKMRTPLARIGTAIFGPRALGN